LARQPEYPPERDITQEEPRVAVFVCHCGRNIGGFLDVPQVAAYAATLPYVIHAEHNLYTCSQDSIAHITEKVKELGANRVVVASCTPLTHQPLFQSSIRAAGLNPYLFEMANIRNQCSWVHSDDWDAATQKAKDLVRMAVGRVVHLQPLHTIAMPVEKTALVVGGGAAGMTAALSLARQGFPVHLVERSDKLGGNLRHLHYSLEAVLNTNNQAGPSDALRTKPQEFLGSLIRDVQGHPLICVHLRTEVLETQGVVGQFTSTLQTEAGERLQVQHGVTILATGGVEYHGPEYMYGQHPRVISQQEFEALLATAEGIAEVRQERREELPDNVVMILCVGPAEEYCSRICCTTALKNALVLKRLKPGAEVTILYRDIRTCGFKERLYTQARQVGVRFIHYDGDRKPTVFCENGRLKVAVWEEALGQPLQFTPDLLVLSNPVVPAEGVHALSKRLKVPLDGNGFFMEAHVKLRPVEFSSDGFFMAGTASYPKSLDETIVEALAASARAATVLAQDVIQVGGSVAVVDASRCVGCLTCVRTCPYHAPRIVSDLVGVGGIRGAAQIEAAACHGCGSCVVACPAKAIQLAHYTDFQMQAKVDALFGNVTAGELVTAT